MGGVDTCEQVYLNTSAASIFVLQKWTMVHPEADQDAGELAVDE